MFAQRRVRRRLVTAAPYARPLGNGIISRAQSECSLQPADYDQQSYGAAAAVSSSASVPFSPAQSLQLQLGHATVASERRRWQMLTWPGAASDHVLKHSLVGGALPAAASLPHCPPGMVLNSSSSLTSPGSVAATVTAAKLSHICRFCSCTLSSSSNRHRHERLKHAAELLSAPSTPATGASRKQSCGAAFSSLRSLASTERAQYSAMEVTGSAESAESGSGTIDQPEDDPVQEIGHGAAVSCAVACMISARVVMAAYGTCMIGGTATEISSTQHIRQARRVVQYTSDTRCSECARQCSISQSVSA